ncbi:MAG: transposase [Candidatus Levybacteria bacterium]|nr:transposase [Candidatus Levybacteria bacterium]
MPARNSRKEYVEDGYYHLYNRGVEKRKIFLDKQDQAVFLSYLKQYLLPKDEKALYERLTAKDISYAEKDKILKLLRLNNFSDNISFLAYCLMPNHFHFFIRQNNAEAIDIFMNSLVTRYVMYFNKKYERIGGLFQGVYKAVRVTTNEQFIHLSRYIHRQALDLQGPIPSGTVQGFTVQGVALREKYPCSYGEYSGLRSTEWIKSEEVLAYFSKHNPTLTYENFVRQGEGDGILDGLTLEED